MNPSSILSLFTVHLAARSVSSAWTIVSIDWTTKCTFIVRIILLVLFGTSHNVSCHNWTTLRLKKSTFYYLNNLVKKQFSLVYR